MVEAPKFTAFDPGITRPPAGNIPGHIVIEVQTGTGVELRKRKSFSRSFYSTLRAVTDILAINLSLKTSQIA
jgi:hypothetical protein